MVAACGRLFHVGIAFTCGSFLAAGTGWDESHLDCEVTTGGCAAAAGSALLQAYVVNQNTDVKEDAMEAPAPGDRTRFIALAEERARGRSLAGTEMTVRDLNMAVLGHMREFRTGSFAVTNLASFFGKVIIVVQDAITSFSNLENVRKAADITGGIRKLGVGLMECVDMLLPDNVKNSSQYSTFKAAWTKTFNDLPTAIDQIEKDIIDYSTKAKPEKLSTVVKTCIAVAMEMTQNYLPNDSATEANKYFDAIRDMMDGIVGGWGAFARGDVVGGVSFVYSGLQATVKGVLPPNLQDNEAFRTIFGVLDKQISKLNEHVMTFKRKLMQSQVCIRRSFARPSDWAQSCGLANDKWAGFYYAGNGVCKKGSSLAQIDGVDTVLLAKSKPQPATETRDALCNTGEQLEKHCYSACPRGWVKTSTGKTCMVECAGNKTFASNFLWLPGDGIMCGETSEVISMTQMEMASTLVLGIARVIDVISQMRKPNADSLSSIIDGAIKLAVAFVHPLCPIQGD